MGNKRINAYVLLGAALPCAAVALINNLASSAQLARRASAGLTQYVLAAFGGLMEAGANHYLSLLPFLLSAVVPAILIAVYLSFQLHGYLYFALIRLGSVTRWWRDIFLRSMGFVLFYTLLQAGAAALLFSLSGHAFNPAAQRFDLAALAASAFFLYVWMTCSLQLAWQVAHNQPALTLAASILLPVFSLGLGRLSESASLHFPGSFGMAYRNSAIRAWLGAQYGEALAPGWPTVPIFALEAAVIIACYVLGRRNLMKNGLGV